MVYSQTPKQRSDRLHNNLDMLRHGAQIEQVLQQGPAPLPNSKISILMSPKLNTAKKRGSKNKPPTITSETDLNTLNSDQHQMSQTIGSDQLNSDIPEEPISKFNANTSRIQTIDHNDFTLQSESFRLRTPKNNQPKKCIVQK